MDSGGSLSKVVYFRPKTSTILPDYVVQDRVLPPSLPGLQPDEKLDLDCVLCCDQLTLQANQRAHCDLLRYLLVRMWTS